MLSLSSEALDLLEPSLNVRRRGLGWSCHAVLPCRCCGLSRSPLDYYLMHHNSTTYAGKIGTSERVDQRLTCDLRTPLLALRAAVFVSRAWASRSDRGRRRRIRTPCCDRSSGKAVPPQCR